ncbi:MAG: aminoacetone oxidase family FAD-binding enzyme [Oscillospiraceae bacterium]|nr:aminoacetone oxidase family FAD-binding enzyme [Oscillospiraceae bacterium]
MRTDADILIIGAGASGMAAAIQAAKDCPGVKIILLERADRPGKKLLTTGNGRCNLSNRDIDISCYNHAAERFSQVLDSYGDDTAFFRSLGLITREDAEGRVYPLSGQASSVLDVLRFAASSSGAEIICSADVTGIEGKEGCFTVLAADGRRFTAGKVIAAVGSPAGAHGYDNKQLIASFQEKGIRFRPFSPALVQLTVSGLPAQLKGTRAVADTALELEDGRIFGEKGEVQFGDGYVSGICVMDLSREYDGEADAVIALDFCPGLTAEEIAESIDAAKTARAESPASNALAGIVPKAVGETVLKQVCKDVFRRKTGSLTAEEIGSIAKLIKRFTLSVSGKGPLKNAQICTGGTEELNGTTLESAECRGLYFCGEIVDVDGKCGGYNLHWAWASGRAAGAAAAEALRAEK